MATTSSNQGAREVYGAVSVDSIGHPSIVSRSVLIADADGAQTNASILTIGSGTTVSVTEILVKASNANTGNVDVLVGFGAATIPSPSATGTNGIVLDERAIPAGGGSGRGNGSGVIAKGADGEDLRLTCSDPAGGHITVTFAYFTE